MKIDYTNTRVLAKSIRKLKLLAAFLGVDQPDALDRAVEEALTARGIPIPSDEDEPALEAAQED